MANELQAFLPTGKTLYAVLLNAIGQVWDGTQFEAIASGTWTDNDIALTEATAGIYLANMPAVGAGSYSYLVYEQAGASPAVTDALVGMGSIDWNGADVLSLTGLAPANEYDARMTALQADLDNPTQYKADVSALALEATLTAIKGAGWTDETLAALKALVDAVKAKTDLMDASSVNIVSPISGTAITILRGDTFECDISGLGSLASYVSLDFTVKSNKSQADTDALIRIRLNATGLTDGLLTLNGATPLSADDGSIAITDAAAGDITITLAASCADDLAVGTYVYDLQLIEVGDVSTLTSGKATVMADVTRAVA